MANSLYVFNGKNWQEPEALSAWMTQGLTWKLSLLRYSGVEHRERVGRTDPRFLQAGRQVEATATSGKHSGRPTSQGPMVLDAWCPCSGDGHCPHAQAMVPWGPCLGLILFKMTTC